DRPGRWRVAVNAVRTCANHGDILPGDLRDAVQYEGLVPSALAVAQHRARQLAAGNHRCRTRWIAGPQLLQTGQELVRRIGYGDVIHAQIHVHLPAGLLRSSLDSGDGRTIAQNAVVGTGRETLVARLGRLG